MYPFLKRTLDLVAAGAGLIVCAPLFLVVIPLLRFTAEGEVWYRQKRIGYKNRPFYILKFATMLKDSPNMLTGSLTLRNDPRVTPVGKYLRISKLNELPQIINVLKGDMSLVGPRPQMEVDFKAFPEHVQERIYDARPGITGIGSIVFRDEERIISESPLAPRACYERWIAPYKGELELWYLKNRSIYTDLVILFLTFWYIFFPESELVYRVFPDLPERPVFLQAEPTREEVVEKVE